MLSCRPGIYLLNAQRSTAEMKANVHFIQVTSWVDEVVRGFQPQLLARARKTYENAETRLAVLHHAKLGLDLCDTGERSGKLVFSWLLSYGEVAASPFLEEAPHKSALLPLVVLACKTDVPQSPRAGGQLAAVQMAAEPSCHTGEVLG